MVQVYRQPLCKRHYSGFLSSAVLYRAASCIVAVILSFLLPYATGGFWKKVALDTVQPAVHYTGDALMVLESNVPGQEQIWTTSPALRSVLSSNSLEANVKVGHEDWNLDGKADLLRFVAEVQSPIDVHSLKLVLQLSYALQGAARLKMYSLAYITAASPLPGSSFSADGQLLLQQLAPLPTTTVSVGLDKPLMDSSSAVPGYPVQGDAVLQLNTLFSTYQARNITTRYENQYPVWKAGSSRKFVVDVKIRIPPHQVHLYRPSTSEMLKWGWVQFVATFWVVWWLLSWVEGLVFQFRVLETRVISDIQTRQQKY